MKGVEIKKKKIEVILSHLEEAGKSLQLAETQKIISQLEEDK